MAKLKREAMGQYNYVVNDNVIVNDKTRQEIRKLKKKFDLQQDASVLLVDQEPEQLLKYKAPKAPQIFESKYTMDFPPPPEQNIMYRQNPLSEENYSRYPQGYHASENVFKTLKGPKQTRPSTEYKKPRQQQLQIQIQRSDSAPHIKQDRTPVKKVVVATNKEEGERGMTPFIRAMINARDNWKHKNEKSFDPMNPDKPKQERETYPYGSYMACEQEGIVDRATHAKSRQKTPAPAKRSVSTASSSRSYSSIGSGAESQMSRSASSVSGSIRSGSSLHRLIQTSQLEPTLSVIEEEEALGETQAIEPSSQEKKEAVKEKSINRQLNKLTKKKQINVMKTRSPDRRFYRSKIRQTPNEMNQYKKMRARTFFKPLEQAIHEKDFIDHETKYQPERQLLQDVRWKIRQDMKNIRNENNMKLVDRYEQRAQLKKEEKQQRLGFPTYADRNPVSIYKVKDVHGMDPPVNALSVKYPMRRRITPSLGSVQRARNLSTHANVWNQACAPPYWGPQKVDNNYFLPKLQYNINSNFKLVR